MRHDNTHSTAAIDPSIKITCCNPAFFETLFNQFAEIFVIFIAGTIFAVEPFLQLFTGCTVDIS